MGLTVPIILKETENKYLYTGSRLPLVTLAAVNHWLHWQQSTIGYIDGSLPVVTLTAVYQWLYGQQSKIVTLAVASQWVHWQQPGADPGFLDRG